MLQQSTCTSQGSRLNKPQGFATNPGQRAVTSHKSIKLTKFRSLLIINPTPHLLHCYYVDSSGLAYILTDSEGLFFSSTRIHRNPYFILLNTLLIHQKFLQLFTGINYVSRLKHFTNIRPVKWGTGWEREKLAAKLQQLTCPRVP